MKELKAKTDAELSNLLAELRREVKAASFGRILGNEKDTSKLAKKKKDIARILTMRNEVKGKSINA